MKPYGFSAPRFGFCSFFLGLLIWLKRDDLIGKTFFIFTVFIGGRGVLFGFDLFVPILIKEINACETASRLVAGKAGLWGKLEKRSGYSYLGFCTRPFNSAPPNQLNPLIGLQLNF